MDIITDAIEIHEDFHSRASTLRADVLQLHGLGKPWEQVDGLCRRIREVIVMLEDILCYALSDHGELVSLYGKHKLQFQLIA